MVSRERLLRLGETIARRVNGPSGRRARLIGRAIAVALLLLLALRLWQLWRRHPVDFGQLDGALFAAAVVASSAAVSAYGFVWPFLLRRLGTPAGLSWITLFFKSQLGKYLPGSVWQYAGRVGLARSRGVPVQRALISIVAEVAYSAIAAAAVSSLILGWLAAGCVLAALALLLVWAIASGRTLSTRPSVVSALRAGPAALALYLIVWGLYGVAFWTTGRALFGVPGSDLPRYVGVFALAWLAGLVAIFAPGGIGVREAVIAALLRNKLGEADAIVLAATSRIVLTAIDFAAGAASFGALRRNHPRTVGAGR
jgi:glycosyltransferase 2 family protein